MSRPHPMACCMLLRLSALHPTDGSAGDDLAVAPRELADGLADGRMPTSSLSDIVTSSPRRCIVNSWGMTRASDLIPGRVSLCEAAPRTG